MNVSTQVKTAGNMKVGGFTDAVTGVSAPIVYINRVPQTHNQCFLVTVLVGGNLITEQVWL